MTQEGKLAKEERREWKVKGSGEGREENKRMHVDVREKDEIIHKTLLTSVCNILFRNNIIDCVIKSHAKD